MLSALSSRDLSDNVVAMRGKQDCRFDQTVSARKEVCPEMMMSSENHFCLQREKNRRSSMSCSKSVKLACSDKSFMVFRLLELKLSKPALSA